MHELPNLPNFIPISLILTLSYGFTLALCNIKHILHTCDGIYRFSGPNNLAQKARKILKDEGNTVGMLTNLQSKHVATCDYIISYIRS